MGRAVTGKAGKIVRALIFSALLCFLLILAGRVLERKSGPSRTVPFLQEKTDIDVLFFGTSHVMDGIYPLELWKEYGITSYNLAFSQSNMATTYWVLREALLTHKPKVVVVDASRSRMSLKTAQEFGMVQTAFDGFPLSMTKIRAANDLLNDDAVNRMLESGKLTKEDAEARKKSSLLLNLLLYHSRWKELTREDFLPSYDSLKGSQYLINVASPADTEELPESEVYDTGGTGYEYMRRIADLCSSMGIQAVFTYLPFPADRAQQKEANTAALIAREKGVPWMNFLRMDTVNYITDCYDHVSHLNASGAKKVTSYLGKYLAEECGVPDHRGEAGYAHWDEDYAAYSAFKEERLKETENLFHYMMLLYEEPYDVCVEVGKGRFLTLDRIQQLFLNLGADPEKISKNTDYILISQGKADVIDKAAGKEGSYETSFGTFRVEYDGERCIRTLDGKVLSDRPELSSDRQEIRFTVYRRGDGSLADEVTFLYSTKKHKSTKAVRSGNGEM